MRGARSIHRPHRPLSESMDRNRHIARSAAERAICRREVPGPKRYMSFLGRRPTNPRECLQLTVRSIGNPVQRRDLKTVIRSAAGWPCMIVTQSGSDYGRSAGMWAVAGSVIQFLGTNDPVGDGEPSRSLTRE